ncbi:MAG: Gfo/Idh/MocA family oxidoreductase [Spirochaetales bacterium]|nr:Gfo/Idh/MocA family oxidoreductase [Spirochaetales bacterium]
MGKLQILFSGLGWMGKSQMALLANTTGVSVPVVVEPKKEEARAFLDSLGMKDTVVTDDYDWALENFRCDIAWIVSPNNFHDGQATKALEKGMHVFCEKPASVTFSAFEKEIELSRKNPKLVTLVNYVLSYNEMEKALIEMVKAGKMGTIEQLQINYRHPINTSGDKAWKLKKAMMGDAFGMGINHAVSIVVHLMETQAKPVAVYATCQNFHIRGFEAQTVHNVMIRYDNGATATVLGNIDRENGYDLYHCLNGTKGSFIFDSRIEERDKIRMWSDDLTDGKWVYPLHEDYHNSDPLMKPFYLGMPLPDSGNAQDHQLGYSIADFLGRIADGTQSILSFDNSHLIAEIGWAAQVSEKTHREVALPISGEDREVALSL